MKSAKNTKSEKSDDIKKPNKVLSVALRPNKLDDIVGQDDIVDTLKKQFKSGRIPHFFLITGPTGSGKCLGAYTKVMLYSGKTKNAQDIEVGDQLMGDDSKPRTVLSTCKGKENMYKISQEYGTDYYVNESHILSLILIKNDDIFKEITGNDYLVPGASIIDISVREYMKLNDEQKACLKGYKVDVDFEEKDTPVRPYTMGMLLLDYSEGIPDIYKYNSYKKRKELLDGIIETKRNWTNEDDLYYEIQHNNLILLEDIQFVARSFGFFAEIKKDSCTLDIRMIFPTRTNIQVSPVEEEYYSQGPEYEYYYGFEIDGNRRFLLEDFTVTHNTTLARIVALMLQNTSPSSDITEGICKYDITEINASDENGVDDIRSVIDKIKYKPLPPSLAKVIIWDEAHQITTPAQNALLKITEEPPESSYIIFCTNNDSKIIPTLKRRAYVINTHGIDKDSTKKLLENAKQKIDYDGPIEDLVEKLDEYGINTPGLILQAAEKFFNGQSASECVSGSTEGSIDTKKLCNYVSKGDWGSCKSMLKLIKKEDIIGIKLCLMGYLKVVLLNSEPDKGLVIAKAMSFINSGTKYEDDLPAFVSTLCIACDIIKNKKVN